MKSITDLIGEHPFFRGLAKKHIDLIAGCALNVRFNKGDMIFREGEPADRFYLIRHGHVSIEIYIPERGPITLQTVGKGEILGWSWLFPPYQWKFDARAIELTRAIAFDGKCIRDKCEAEPSLGYELMKRFAQVIANRLEATRLQILDVYGPHRESTIKK